MATVRISAQDERHTPLTLIAFAGVVLIGGSNLVVIGFSNQELPPLFGAGLRFAISALLFLAFVGVRRIPLPTGRGLVGAVLFGVAFTTALGLAYWARLSLPAGISGIIFSSIPLITLFLALLQRLESFRWQALVGGVLTLAGVGVVLKAPLPVNVISARSVLAMIAAAVCAAEAGLVVKKFPPSHPMATNGLAMASGALLLLIASRVAREQWSIPNRQTTWVALSYLVLLGSVGLFGLYLFVLKRWTASGASYQFVLMPIVTVLLAAWLTEEPISVGVVLGGAIVLAGIYVGVLSRREVPILAPQEQEALAQRCATC